MYLRLLLCKTQKSMAVSSAFVVTRKLEKLLANPTSSSPAPLGVIGIRALPMNTNRNKRGLIQRARCEISPSKAASISALEQLKTSAIDSTNFSACLMFEINDGFLLILPLRLPILNFEHFSIL